jgi:hypothetical protein
MALDLKLAKGTVDSELAFFHITDSTGAYSVTNPGGYNTPNPARNTLALYLYGYEYRETVDDVLLVINNTIPLTVTEWQIDVTTDKYRYFTLLGIPIWTTAAYTFNAVNPPLVHYNSVYYKCLQSSTNLNPINNPLYWEVISDLTTAAILANTTIYTDRLDLVTNWNAKQCYQSQIFAEARDCDCKGTNRAEVRPYQKIFVQIYAAGLKCAQGQYAQADDILTAVNEYCSTLNCEGC